MKDSSVVVSKGVKRRFHPTRKQVILAGVVIAAIILVSGSTFLFLRHRTSTATNKVGAALVTANAQMSKANYKAATATLQSVENLPASKSQKVQMYSMLASAAMVQNKSSDMMLYYQKKHTLDPASANEDALNLAVYYQRTGDKQNAIEQYKLALAYLQSQPSTGDMAMQHKMDLGTVKARLEELGVKQ